MRSFPIAVFVFTLVGCGSSVTSTPLGGGTGAGAAGTTSSAAAGMSVGNGGEISVGTSTGSSGTTGSSAGTGGGPSTGDCATDADCPGGKCVELTPGGYKICIDPPPPEAMMCQPPGQPIMDQCCTSSDCKSGKCYSTDSIPHCSGGPAMPNYNECVTDTCASDADCMSQMIAPSLCAPAGAYGYPARACVTAYCHTNADCPAVGGVPEGSCEPVRGGCCDIPLGLACVYKGGCKQQSDCGQNAHCDIDKTSGGVCKPGIAPCPV